VFDCAIIVASFALDLVFVEGITGAEGEEALAIIIVFLLWRILRIINGNGERPCARPYSCSVEKSVI